MPVFFARSIIFWPAGRIKSAAISFSTRTLLVPAQLLFGLRGVKSSFVRSSSILFGMLSILKAMVWSPLPFPAADRLVQVGWRDRAADFPEDVNSLRGADLLDWRERLAGRAVVAGQGQASINLACGDTVERHDGAFVTANLFSTLGVAPTLGRDFLAEDEQPGAAPVVVLSHDLWRNRFGADPAVVGREVRVNAMPATIMSTFGMLSVTMRLPKLSTWRRSALRAAASSSTGQQWPGTIITSNSRKPWPASFVRQSTAFIDSVYE